MSKAKWFVVRKPNTGEIIDPSPNQIVPLEISEIPQNSSEAQKCCTTFTRPSFPLGGLMVGLGSRLYCWLILASFPDPFLLFLFGPGNEARLIHSLYISLCLVILLVYLARPCMIEIYDEESLCVFTKD